MNDRLSDLDTRSSAAQEPEREGRFLRIFTPQGSNDVRLEEGIWTVGRAADAHIRIDDPSVSRAHAKLHVGAHVLLEDLGSVNGTAANAKRLDPGKPVLVTAGMPLELGDAVAVLRGREERGPSMRSTIDGDGGVGERPRMERMLTRIAQADLPVLIEGETGSGKDFMAQRLHASSRRAQGPLVRASCALVRAGHLDLADCFARAAGGTLVLDEITTLDANGQALFIGAWERAAELTGQPLARIVSMSSVGLEQAVDAGQFRADLYYRLAHLTLRVPPLRTRLSELADIAQSLSTELASANGQPAPLLSGDAVRALQRYPWPGNVRELRIALERAMVLSHARVLTASHFEELDPRAGARRTQKAAPNAAQAPAGAGPLTPDEVRARPANQSLKEAAAAAEYERIVETLRSCHGNQTRAAKLLGISRGTLIARLERYNVPRPRKS